MRRVAPDPEFDLMKRYYGGDIIDGDIMKKRLEGKLHPSAGIPNVSGFHKTSEGYYAPTTKLRDLSIKIFYKERIRRNPVYRFLHSLIHGV